jgi:hypothetical protein
MRKNLLLTYDYELFLGSQSGEVEDCLIRPTNRLISIMDEFGVKSAFFIDTVYLMRLKQQAETVKACADDLIKIKLQLQEIVRKGHYIYPHIHPHWLDAVYLRATNEWNLDNIEKYRFTNVSKEEQRVIFKASYDILKDIVNEINPSYQIDAHRAGGWSVQPFTNFKPLYEEYNFKYDFSVIDRYYMFTEAQFFDYSAIPRKKIYRFEDDVTVESDKGKFIEFVNSTLRVRPHIKFFDRLMLKILYKVGRDYSYGKGSGQAASRIATAKPVSDEGFDMTNNNFQYIAAEQLSFIKKTTYLSYIKNHDYMHFVSHPKMVTSHNLTSFRKFLKNVVKNYTVETDFKKMV